MAREPLPITDDLEINMFLSGPDAPPARRAIEELLFSEPLPSRLREAFALNVRREVLMRMLEEAESAESVSEREVPSPTE